MPHTARRQPGLILPHSRVTECIALRTHRRAGRTDISRKDTLSIGTASILHGRLMPPPAPLQALRSTFNRAEPVRVGQAAPIGWHLLYFRAYELLSKDLGADGYENWRT